MALHGPPSLPSSPIAKRPKFGETTNAEDPATTMATIASNGDIQRNVAQTESVVDQHAADSSRVERLQVKLLSGKAKAPTKGSAFSAGYDMYSAESTSVPARGQALVSTQIAIAVPQGTYGRVAPRSGLAVKHSITTGAGVIDYDYRGEVRVLLYNLSDNDFTISEGDRIAQLVLERIVTPDVIVMEELSTTERGAGGFGSTGGFGGALSGGNETNKVL